jgi:zinc transport system substrate-binding protein
LIQGNQSPHDFSLKPSDMLMLQHADLVIWVAPEVEASLARLFEKGNFNGRFMALTRMEGLQGVPARRGVEWSSGTTEHHHSQATDIDSHIWLSPEVALHIVSQVTELLCEMDRANADLYRHNSRQLSQRLEQLDAELASILSPVKDRPYVVFHDAYHYFEQRYGLNVVGSVSVSPERKPGARHIHELRSKITRLQARCIFSEPQFRPKLVETLIEGSDAKAGQLDPLGCDLDAGPDAYFLLMRRLADNIVECLQ